MSRIAKLKEYLAAQPGDSFLQHALALEYIKLGEDALARKLFEELLKQNPAYVGSYYHLGKLLERNGWASEALITYKQGMEQAKIAGDQHAWNELQAAYEDLQDD